MKNIISRKILKMLKIVQRGCTYFSTCFKNISGNWGTCTQIIGGLGMIYWELSPGLNTC